MRCTHWSERELPARSHLRWPAIDCDQDGRAPNRIAYRQRFSRAGRPLRSLCLLSDLCVDLTPVPLAKKFLGEGLVAALLRCVY